MLHGELGTCLARIDRTVEAMPCFERAIELEPKDGTHVANLAAALKQQEIGRESRRERV